jgi:hypothetical protein
MTHYAKLAATGFRVLAVTGFLFTLPGLFMMFRMSGMAGMGTAGFGQSVNWMFVGLSHPLFAVILFFVAKPLGNLVGRGLD